MRQTLASIAATRRGDALRAAATVLIASFLLLRFIDPLADFPSGLEYSGSLYTDEGFYSRAAVRACRDMHWHAPGELNTAVSMPLGQIILYAFFRLFGPSLVTARTVTALASVATVLITFLFVLRMSNARAAFIAAMLLTINYAVYGYSRFAIMENLAMPFIAGSLLIACQDEPRSRLSRGAWSGVLVALAVLVKTSSVFVAPVILLGILTAREHWRTRAAEAFIFASVLACLLGIHLVWSRHFYPDDVAAFAAANLGARRHSSVFGWLRQLPGVFVNLRTLGVLPIAALTILVGACCVFVPKFSQRRIVVVMAGCFLSYAFLVSLIQYRPGRYYLHFVPPAAVLIAVASTALAERFRGSRSAWVAITSSLVVTGVLLVEGVRIVHRASSAPHSFSRMLDGVREEITAHHSDLRLVPVTGLMADTLALSLGVDGYGLLPVGPTETAEQKLLRVRPAYLVTHAAAETTTATEIVDAIGGSATRAGVWDVYGNLVTGRPVELYSLCWRQHAPTAVSPPIVDPSPLP
jgi:hypothetical protein